MCRKNHLVKMSGIQSPFLFQGDHDGYVEATCIIPKGMNEHHHCSYPIIKLQCFLKKDFQAVAYAFAKPPQQLPVILKKLAENNGNTEDILPVRDRIQDFLSQPLTELCNYLGMTR